MGRLRLLVAGRQPVSGGRLALLALVVLAGATACQPGGVTGVMVPCTPPSGSVGGCVTHSRGGAAVAGAAITASPAGTTATTGSQGAYSLAHTPRPHDI